MAWQTIRVANPYRSRNGIFEDMFGTPTPKGGRDRRRYSTREGKGRVDTASAIFYGDKATHKALARRKRKRKKAKKPWLGGWTGEGNPRRRNNALTDLLAGDIASKVSSSVIGALSGKRKRKKTVKRKKRNTQAVRLSHWWGGGARSRRKYKSVRKGSARSKTSGTGLTTTQKSIVRHYRKKRRKSGLTIGNPHLALIGSNLHKPKRRTTMAKARRRRRNSLKGRRRNAKGQLMKVKANPRRRRKSSRRRNVARANPRRRRRNRVRVITKIKYRTRRVNVAKRRKRKSTRRRSRRRNTAALAAVNPRRRRRRSGGRKRRRNMAAVNPRRRRRARVTRRRRRNLGRRNAGGMLGGFLGRINLAQVAEVTVGTLVGNKVATWGGAKVASMVGVTDPMMTGLIKAGIGVGLAGFVSKFRPAFALGLAAGAVSGLVDQYIVTPYITPYLPMAGMGDYVNRTWKEDNWLASGGAPGALAGMGNNSLNRSSL